MTPEILALVILVICIVLFITQPIPNATTACLGCALYALTGVCSVDKAFSGFSNSIVILVFGMMVVGVAIMDTGVAELVGSWVAKVSGGSERLFILLAGLVSVVLSAFLSNTSVIAVFLPIIASTAKAHPKMTRKNMTLPVTMGAMFGGVCTLVGSTPQLTADGILSEMTGHELAMFDMLMPGLILTAIYMVYVLTIGHWIGNRVWGEENPNEHVPMEDMKEKQIVVDKRKLITMLVIFVLIIVMFIGEWIPVAMTAATAALLCIITGCTDQKTILREMDWPVLFILAGCLGLAAGLTDSGAGQLLADVLLRVIPADIAPMVVFAIFVAATMVISNFITNSTAVVITLPIAIALCVAEGFNPIAYTLGIVYAANLTFSTPLANAQTAMTLVAGYKFSDYFRYTSLLVVAVYIGILVAVPMFFPLV
ncbi:MAG: SLC13/DASS family transporter [Ruminococcaceae bacterium]|nr:SLC13/DASS family transporter [Oscillospiraceae bacterium]